MSMRRRSVIGAIVAATGLAVWRYWPRDLIDLAVAAPTLARPDGVLKTYHLGHSLVGRDMPAMLAQLAGHDYASQLGWGTSLRDHWAGPDKINGFAEENAHDRFVPASDLATGGVAALILTEVVDIHDAVKYHDSAEYLAKWGTLARTSNPDTRVYLYETWPHRVDDASWLARIDADHDAYWQDRILRPAAAKAGPIHMIPAGQVLAAYLRAGADGPDLLARTDAQAVDSIHLGDQGNYLVALTHYATLYGRDPAGLPHELLRADGTPATPPDPRQAALMQKIVWDVVSNHPLTGVSR